MADIIQFDICGTSGRKAGEIMINPEFVVAIAPHPGSTGTATMCYVSVVGGTAPIMVVGAADAAAKGSVFSFDSGDLAGCTTLRGLLPHAGHSQIGSPRRGENRSIRQCLVAPFLVFYDFDPEKDLVRIVRVLHERRSISDDMLDA